MKIVLVMIVYKPAHVSMNAHSLVGSSTQRVSTGKRLINGKMNQWKLSALVGGQTLMDKINKNDVLASQPWW